MTYSKSGNTEREKDVLKIRQLRFRVQRDSRWVSARSRGRKKREREREREEEETER